MILKQAVTNKMLVLVILVGFFVVLISVSNVSAASTVYVNATTGNDSNSGNETNPFLTIGKGISSVDENGTVQISNGIYSGENNNNITINKNMTIKGENQISTIINGSNLNWIFNVEKDKSVIIQNLTFINGYRYQLGGAIYSDGILNVYNCNFTENIAYYRGGAIYNNGTLNVTSSVFTRNRAETIGYSNGEAWGGAIFSIYKPMTITNSTFIANTALYGEAIFTNGDNSSINECIFTNNSGGIYGTIYNWGPLTINNSKFTDNKANHSWGGFGGAIENRGSLNINNSTFTRNMGPSGGAIFTDMGTLNVNNCTFINNTADNGGAIFNYYMSLTIVNSSFSGNCGDSGSGGAIYNNGGITDVTGSTFINNMARDQGGAIYNSNQITAHFNRFIGNNTAVNGTDIYNSGSLDAEYNWWGSNTDPLTRIYNATVFKWLVLNSITNTTSILQNGLATIIVDLTHDNGGAYHDPANGHIPDGIPIIFTATIGTINSPVTMVNGVAQTTFQGGTYSGNADISTRLDSETIHNSVTIDVTSPTASANIKTGLYKTDKVIYLTMNEPGTIYYTTNGITPTTVSTKYIGPISITSTTTLKFIAVDNAGNVSPVYTEKYTIDKTAPKVISTYPKRYATGVSRTRTIYLKFSEKIKASSYWSKIVVKNRYGRAVSISKSISGNVLYIKTKYKRSSYSYYTVYIPAAALKDYAGNNLAVRYTFKFKTGRY